MCHRTRADSNPAAYPDNHGYPWDNHEYPLRGMLRGYPWDNRSSRSMYKTTRKYLYFLFIVSICNPRMYRVYIICAPCARPGPGVCHHDGRACAGPGAPLFALPPPPKRAAPHRPPPPGRASARRRTRARVRCAACAVCAVWCCLTVALARTDVVDV